MRIPDKLQKGDEIRVIAPSRSATILSEEGIAQAKKRLEDLGFMVTFANIFSNQIYSFQRQLSIGLKIFMMLFGIKR